MPTRSALSTRVLLICAVVAVATGIVSGIAGLLSAPVIAVAPVAYGLLLTAHALPGALAQALLRQRWVALITHALAAIIVIAMMPPLAPSALTAVVLMGGIQEGWAALGRYKRWGAGWMSAGAAALGLVLGLTAGLIIGLKHLPAWGTILCVALTVVGAVLWTLVAIAAGNALHRAGIARTY